MSDDYETEKPWTEEQWLAEFRRSDARSARFGELLETLIDHPDREAIISQEMGWNRDEDGEPIDVPPFDEADDMDDLMEAETPTEAERSIDEDADDAHEPSGNLMDDLLHDEDEDDRAEGGPLLSAVPAYQEAVKLAALVLDLGKGREERKFTNVRHEERFSDLIGNSLIPAVKMRGGHSFGFDDHICANIVCNRFALESAEKAEEALLELLAAAVLSSEYERVLPQLREVIRLLHERIAELRTKVWW